MFHIVIVNKKENLDFNMIFIIVYKKFKCYYFWLFLMKVIQQNLPSLLLLILSIQIILGYYTISEVNAQIDQTENLTNQSQSLQVNPGTIEPQPLKDARTGVDQKFPGKLIGILDPNTGQIIAKKVEVIPPKVTGPSVVGNSQANGLFGTAPPETGLGGFGAPVNPNGVLTNEGLGTELLFSTSSPVLTPNAGVGNAAPPTYNPPLKKCDTGASGNSLGGFDIAKYSFTGNMDRDNLKGDEFGFQVFADLVDNDDFEIEGEDKPYKVTMLTDNGDEKVKVHMKEIATLCIDTQNAINVEQITEVDLEKSDLFRSLEY